MATSVTEPAGSERLPRVQHPAFVPLTLVAMGVLLRLALAAGTYLNPDEAYHFFLADRTSLMMAYKASLTSAHPPLFTVLLYYVRRIGDSELILRLPSVIAGGLFIWFTHKWVDVIAGRRAAIIATSLAALSPTLVLLGAEVRQYSLLLCFLAISLYLFEQATRECSTGMMALFAGFEALAVLTHYSGVFFAAAIFIYAAARFVLDSRLRTRLFAVWGLGQAVLLGLVGFLYLTHIRTMARGGTAQAISSTYLGREIFDPTRSNVISFAGRETFRLFHYIAGQPVVGGCWLLLYIVGLVLTWREKKSKQGSESARELVLFLLIPFVFVLIAALARSYPYGGVRQCVFLAPFVIAGASLGLARLALRPAGVVVSITLLIAWSYILPRPLGPYIWPRDQRQSLMMSAIADIHAEAPAGSVFLLDNQSNFAFRYYFCRDQVIDFNLPARAFIDFDCGPYRASAPMADAWMYTPGQLGPAMEHAATRYRLPAGADIWFFQSGWAVDVEPALRAKMAELGCVYQRQFGANIVICKLANGTARSSFSKIHPALGL